MKKTLVWLMVLMAILPSCVQKKSRVNAPIFVRVLTVQDESGTSVRNYVGEVEPETKVNLAFRLGGTLTTLRVRNGEYVRVGQPIASVDDTRARALHDAALATLRQAEDGYARMESVYKEGGISDVRWVQMLTDLEKARQSEISTRQNVEDCYMKAPIDGVVEVRNVSVGSSMAPAEPFATIQDVHVMNVRYSIPEREIGRVEVGDVVEVGLPALGTEPLKATVLERSLVANPMGHTYSVKARLESHSGVLPGMVAKVRTTKTASVGVVLPTNCIQTVYDGYVVWVVEDSVVNRRHVQFSDIVRNGVLVSEGLDEGDVVVVDGYQKLYPGAKVSY